MREYLGISDKHRARRELKSERGKAIRQSTAHAADQKEMLMKSYRAALSRSFIKFGGHNEKNDVPECDKAIDPEVFEMVEASCTS